MEEETFMKTQLKKRVIDRHNAGVIDDAKRDELVDMLDNLAISASDLLQEKR